MKVLHDLIATYGDDYLVCSGDMPFIGTDSIADEMIFYCLDEATENKIIDRFNRISGKDVSRNTMITTLSGGQKVILMTLLALYSPAKKILFHKLMHNLDTNNRQLISGLIEEFSAHKIIKEMDQC